MEPPPGARAITVRRSLALAVSWGQSLHERVRDFKRQVWPPWFLSRKEYSGYLSYEANPAVWASDLERGSPRGVPGDSRAASRDRALNPATAVGAEVRPLSIERGNPAGARPRFGRQPVSFRPRQAGGTEYANALNGGRPPRLGQLCQISAAAVRSAPDFPEGRTTRFTQITVVSFVCMLCGTDYGRR